MDKSIDKVVKAIPTAKEYGKKLKERVDAQEKAPNAKEEKKDLILGAETTEEGAQNVKENPELLELTSKTAPQQLKQLAKEIKDKDKDFLPRVEKLMKKFREMVEKALKDYPKHAA